MNCKQTRLTLVGVLLGLSSAYGATSPKPDFSGVWVLDRQKSDLKSPPINADQPHSGGGGTGAPRTGGGGRGMGGGSGGGHRGGGGGGGMRTSSSRGAAGYSPMKLDIDAYQVSEVADKLTIVHADPTITIKPEEKTASSEQQQPEQPLELKYTADGKTRETTMADGGSIKSKTDWEGQQLVTKSKEKSTLGSMEIDEARSLSADGNTLTINLSFKGGSSHWTQKAVYTKQKQDTKPGEK